MESPFLSCNGAPIRYDFVGGHCSIIAPVVIGLNCMVAAKTRVNPGIYSDNVMIAGGNLEREIVIDVQRIRSLKDMTSKYKILVSQLAVAVSYRKWCRLRTEWARDVRLDEFEQRLIQGHAGKVDKFIGSLEDYGDNIAKYLLAAEEHSRPDSLNVNREIAIRWLDQLKPQTRAALEEESALSGAVGELKSAMVNVYSDNQGFYDTLAKLDYDSPVVSNARDYFERASAEMIRQAGL
jgi:hypothetical protein